MKTLKYFLKWSGVSLMVSLLSGTASAVFLITLQWCTSYRVQHQWLIFLLPVGGLVVALLYRFLSKESQAGNNLILQQISICSKILPVLMAPLVLLGTLVTHLLGGSAGREGTALQMSASLSDQISKIFKLHSNDRKILLMSSLSAGFGSVFGTPFAGFVFAFELIFNKKIEIKAVFPVLLSSILADLVTTHIWSVGHNSYKMQAVSFEINTIGYLLLAGLVFGMFSRFFVDAITLWKKLLYLISKNELIHSVIGGIVVILLALLIGSTRYLGLGLPVISEAFTHQLSFEDSFFKLLFTAITLGAGYKGGEVTPLFFIGATLGSALAIFIPMDLNILVGIGFVSVFSGATKTPIACVVMAMELFHPTMAMYTIVPCFVATAVAKNKNIYSAQVKKIL